MVTDIEDRVVGCIIGEAIGDALGGPYEGQSGPITLRPDAPWRLSDDTQLTLATCEAITNAGNVFPADIAARFAYWFRRGRVSGVGASTLKALRDLAVGAHWAIAGQVGERSAGNGAAMRAAPLAFCLDPECPEQRTILRDVSRITHHNDEAYAGAMAVVLSVRAFAFGNCQPGVNLLGQIAAALPDTTVRDRLQALGELDPVTPPVDVAKRFGCSGFVAESVPLAIFAAQRIGNTGFQQVLGDVIEAGGDTDTIASITGQIAGAWVGLSGIPPDMVKQLPESHEILQTARAFAAVVTEKGKC